MAGAPGDDGVYVASIFESGLKLHSSLPKSLGFSLTTTGKIKLLK